ncbi:MAG: aminotransferase class I/II-fold pyridoxal phosphate-dependent enzyme, partial [Verrucomicrobiae bacterium]|nr:aminotransferase class I/II-fold pyridoxal phosphate-dependent enzyme [Verrucomicrobiae bacterium]
MSAAPIRFSHLGNLAEPPVISDIMKVALEDKHLLSLAAGFTDTEGLPVKFIRDAAVSLATSGKVPEYLQYGTTAGRPKLRKMVARRLSRFDNHQSPSYHPDNVLLSNGSQQALYLAVQVLCNPGDIVLVENPSYFVFLELLKGQGVQAVGMPVDAEDEIDAEALGNLLDNMEKEGARDRIKAIYIESWFSNPAAHCLSNAKKAELAEVLKSRELVVPMLEDGAYLELFFEEKYPSRTLFALRAFDEFPKI